MKYGGWFKIAFEHELNEELTTVRVGERRLLCVRTAEGFRVVDAVCPHRGADLGVNGRLDGDAVICGYHGHRIPIATRARRAGCPRSHPSLALGGIFFARVGEVEDGDFPGFLRALHETHHLVPGFTRSIRVAPELVIENAFDAAHFGPVHGVLDVEAEPPAVEAGVFTARTTLHVAPTQWQGERGGVAAESRIRVPLFARAFSPNLTVTAIAPGGDHPHYVIAGAVPEPDGSCTIRLSLALERRDGVAEPDTELAKLLLEFESMGLEQDRPVWENLTPVAPGWVPGDATVLAYRKFCERFLLEADGRSRG